VIPFFRYPDQALLGPERNYVPPVRDASASQASLRLNYVLGQDAYGSRCEVPRAAMQLPVPGLAVGRLVERPSEVGLMVEAYLGTRDGVVEAPSRALVTGYDFLVDAALAVRSELEGGLGQAVGTLITPADRPPAEGWTAEQLRQVLFTTRNDLIFLAGHFSAFSALAADYSTQVTALELLGAAADFRNTLVVSAGCHSAYNAVDADGVPWVTPEPDWPQAFARRQATLIAGTGYQYGDTDFIEYSERLYLEFFRELRRGTGPVSIGGALARAKERYLATTPVVRALHEKAYLQATLFGLPMLRIALPAGRGGVAPVDAPVVSATLAYAADPGSTLGLRYADLGVTPTFPPARTLVLNDFENAGQVTATYFEGRDGIVNNPAEPILPLEVRNVAVSGTVVRGVGFRGGTYEDLPDILPLTGAATTEIRGVHAGFPTESFFPIQPWTVNHLDGLCVSAGRVTRLNVTPAQFRAGEGSALTGVLRRFQQMDFRLFYSANLASYPPGGGSTPGRSGPPSIAGVLATSGAGGVRFVTRVAGNPSAGVQEVWVTYTATQGPLRGRWQSLDLTQSATDSTLWESVLVLDNQTLPSDLRYMVQAVNGVGMVALNARQGRYHVPDQADGAADTGAQPSEIALLNPPSGAAFGSRVTLQARLTSNGVPAEGRGLQFQIGDQVAFGRTGTGAEAGIATVTVSLATLPGQYDLKATFPGGFDFNPSWSSAPFRVTRASTAIGFVTPNPVVGAGATETVTALLTDGAGTPIAERTVLFLVEGGGNSLVRPAITDFAGRARLGAVGVGTGSYQVRAWFASRVSGLPGVQGSIDLTDPRYLPSDGATTLWVDADPPVVTGVTATPSVLSIPNHKMVAVAVSVAASDASGSPGSRIVGVQSSEPENGLGDGDQAPDWEITGALTVSLRSERSQNGTGRVYTILVETTDRLGNQRRDTTTVVVPK